MNPAPGVVELASRPNVVVTGAVPDVRPYLQHAAAVVAPLRVARGIQNKVLEAMAMERPFVASVAAGSSLSGVKGRDLEVADSPEDFVAKVEKVLEPTLGAEMGRRGRQAIVSGYAWTRNLAAFDDLLQERAVPSARAAL
jgi:glycosyltransferase involved in cell wall biosynthesis